MNTNTQAGECPECGDPSTELNGLCEWCSGALGGHKHGYPYDYGSVTDVWNCLDSDCSIESPCVTCKLNERTG